MEQHTITETPASPPKSDHTAVKRLMYGTLVLALMASSSYATFAWQQRKIDSLDSNLSSSKQKADFLAAQQEGLSDQLTKLSERNDELLAALPEPLQKAVNEKPTPSGTEADIEKENKPLKVTIGDTRRYPVGTNAASWHAVAVDVTVSNEATKPQNMLVSDFKFAGESFAESRGFGTFAGETMSNGSVVLDSQTLAPGQTVKGTIVFNTLGEPYGMFKMTYDKQTFQFTLQR